MRVEVEGTARLTARLRATVPKPGSAVVGYTAEYALYVHENLEARHAPGKFAKFLEEPARRLYSSGALGRLAAQKGGLLLCALAVQRESMLIVPVDTGYLKNSSFVEVEKVGGSAAPFPG